MDQAGVTAFSGQVLSVRYLGYSWEVRTDPVVIQFFVRTSTLINETELCKMYISYSIEKEIVRPKEIKLSHVEY